jgi:membrane protease YdiL (CAAX protease family)
MNEQSDINYLYREKRFLFLLFAPVPIWIYLYCTHTTNYIYSLEFFLTFALLYPIAEEILFRGLMQPLLAAKLPAKIATISTANIITSLLFSAAHLINHSPLWALATFIPSLIYGYAMDRYRNLNAPIILHCVYNAGYFAVAGQI